LLVAPTVASIVSARAFAASAPPTRASSSDESTAFDDNERALDAAPERELTPEERERAEDAAALARYKLYALGLVAAAVCAYCGDAYAKRRIGFKEKDSTYVSVTTRGRPSLGGPFVLVNCDGDVVSQADFLGKWVFFYFGFVHCPEICPIELNRMTKVVDAVRAQRPRDTLQPLFVSCDVKRDSLAAIREYLSIFHKDFIGLSGTPNQINATCKSYRIYYSLPDEESASSGDYLIDHSIAIFLFDPQGRFVDFFGSRYDHNEISAKVVEYMAKHEADPEWTNY
jgi:protein SCO1/2